jgi:hypothetical protein
MKNKALVMMMGLFLASGFAFAGPGSFKPGTEPDGFRGMAWATDLSGLSGFVLTQTLSPGREVYIKTDEDLTVFSHAARKIEYMFYGRKLHHVLISFKDKDGATYRALKEGFFKTYGEGSKVSTDLYEWAGAKTRLSLVWNTSFKDGECTIELRVN